MNEHEQALKQLMAHGLGALKKGGQIGAKAADEIENDASNPQLKTALNQGTEQAKTWATRIDRALQEAGGTDYDDNPIMEAHYEVAKRIRADAPDDFSRDLGIIASGQLALHYWIASFGTMRAYAKRVGLNQTEQDMAQCLQEAESADKEMTGIAVDIMGG